ncbi:MAG TPA: MBL fold metallo-hydrolase [Anaerolineaceae bacterium]|nr:MBL fold metallo-hydrolase [Anaerolineaceae bacterium]HPN50813.1 MBL fold metallo-hydrolase [Anaerolineaceae bacterium]
MNEKLSEFTVQFWGVRGSYPIARRDSMGYGGNTSCVAVTVKNHLIILDAGTGIIPLGQTMVKKSFQTGQAMRYTLLFSHLHHDHNQGFPFFAPNFFPKTQGAIMGPAFGGSNPEETLLTMMCPPYFPVRLEDVSARLSFNVLRDRDTIILNDYGSHTIYHASEPLPQENPGVVKIRVMRSYGHPEGVLHYRIEYAGKSMVYATDTEGYHNGDQRTIAFAKGADILIHDAQYTEEHYVGKMGGIVQGYGHSTVNMACDVAHYAQVGQLVLFHHAPEYTDEQMDQVQAFARKLFPQSMAAYEGLTMVLVNQALEANAKKAMVDSEV